MPYVKIWIHAVWTVKNRLPIIKTEELRKKLFEHIHQNALSKNILMEIVDGHCDHVHCLFRIRSDQSIENVMQLIKGESSFWFNKNNFSTQKLNWQSEYYAVSVSESKVGVVKKYISNQEKHHKKKTWEDEYREFISRYGFKVVNG